MVVVDIIRVGDLRIVVVKVDTEVMLDTVATEEAERDTINKLGLDTKVIEVAKHKSTMVVGRGIAVSIGMLGLNNFINYIEADT